ncbi:MAG TPA: aldolase/citrate lyase family protein [Jatrophihabitans sp.]|nr:aldolase/citrate lyase family protein [Jatrophihabitans sp.]
MYPQPNRVKDKLSTGEPIVGSLTLLHEPAIGEILGGAGYDFLIIDMEHAGSDEQSVLAMVRACEAAGVTPLVRIRRIEEKEILWSLDTGAGGLVLPLVDSGADAQEVTRLMHYPPYGERTLCSAARAAGHGTMRHDFDAYLAWAERSTTSVCLVETPRGISELDKIAAAGVDVVMIGRGDLSLKLGHGYAPQHPEVEAISIEFARRVTAAGACAGILAYSVAEARKWIEHGYRFIVFSQPEMVLSNFYRDARAELLA